MSSITIDNLHKSFGGVEVVNGLSLTVEEGEFLCLLGPSGCGKTTTLRCVAGFEEIDAGDIRFGEASVTNLPPNKRRIGMVFQNYALFPHLNVYENVAYGLKAQRIATADIPGRVARSLELVQLEGFDKRYPAELSGGQQQRVALARALVVEPGVLLLDEPLSNLDASLRHSTRYELRQLQKRLGLTALYVTHDQEEAMTLADRIGVMTGGILQQVGTPLEVYRRPANRFVALFLGDCNILPGSIENGVFAVDSSLRLPLPQDAIESEEAGIRPEEIHLLEKGETPPPGTIIIGEATVISVSWSGVQSEVILQAGEHQIKATQPGHSTAKPLQVGYKLQLATPPKAVLLFKKV
jgi:ABC-type Fe3+/spermidine/putrescine transport system ATPase subunit